MRIPFGLFGLILACFVSTAAVACGAGKLGTSRTITLDPAEFRQVNGLERKLGLRRGEVVLTFDDGPMPGTTSAILKALKAECAKATFFTVGRMAKAYPRVARKVLAEGHTLAHHTHRHSRLTAFSLEAAAKRIDQGIAAVERVAYGGKQTAPRVPLFRYPYLATNSKLNKLVAGKGLVSVGANIDSRDWALKSADAVHDRIMKRLRQDGKGIVLMHDIHARTAKMLPRLLRSLSEGGYRIVHLVAPTRRETPPDAPIVASADDAKIVTASLGNHPRSPTAPSRSKALQVGADQAKFRETQLALGSRPVKHRVRQSVKVASRTVFVGKGWRLRRSQWIIR